MSNPSMLICLPFNSPVPQPPGSLPAKCSDCGAQISLSPSSLLIIHDNPGIKVVCVACSCYYPTLKVRPPTPSQMAEIIEATGSSYG